MSFNISSDLMAVADSVSIHINTTKFGPRQIISFKRAVETGILKNTSAPIMIARQIRLNAGQPFVHFCKYGRMYWGNIPKDCAVFYDTMTAAVVAAEMRHDANDYYAAARKKAVAETKILLAKRAPHGSFNEYDNTTKMVMVGLKFPQFKIELPEMFTLEVNRTLTNAWSNPCDT